MKKTLTWKGKDVAFVEGETLALTLTKADTGNSGFGVSPTGRVFGLFCGIGACQGCLVRVEGRGVVEACLTMSEPGMRVESAYAIAKTPAPRDDAHDDHG